MGKSISIASLIVIALGKSVSQEPCLPNQALNDPTGFAWSLFETVNAVPSAHTSLVNWQTWALAESIFAVSSHPPDKVSASAKGALRNAPNFQAHLFKTPKKLAGNNFVPEVRINDTGFQFIRANALYSIKGQVSYLERNEKVSFPVGTIDIKAEWAETRDDFSLDESEYLMRRDTVKDANSTQVIRYRLIGLHIASKGIPNWFWATFVHRNPFGGNRAPVGSPPPRYVTDRLAEKHWQYYNLVCTQTQFTDEIGLADSCSNFTIEDEGQSSCISCHATASVTRDIRREILVENPFAGIPYWKWYFDTTKVPPQQRYYQMDFVWSLVDRAK